MDNVNEQINVQCEEYDNDNNPFGNIIFSYTWDDAVNDGTFVDITPIAKTMGFKVPTALTRNLYSNHVKAFDDSGNENPKATNDNVCQLLLSLHEATTNAKEPSNIIAFMENLGKDDISLFATIEARSPNNPEPVMTLMLTEDY